MAIGAGAAGAWAAVNATTQTVTLPAHSTGDLLLLIAACKAATMTSLDVQVTTPSSGWTKIGSFADSATASGTGVGGVRQAIWFKVATSGAETNPVVTWGGAQTAAPGLAVALGFTKAGGEFWLQPVALQKATNAATSISVTMDSNPGITAGDWGVGVHTIADDSALTVPTWTATSATLAAAVVYPTTPIASGTSNDMAATAVYRSVTSGTASAAPVVTGTAAAAETGTTAFIRLRVAATRPPQFISAGAGIGGTVTTLDVPIPAGSQSGDIEFMHVLVHSSSATEPATPSGWSRLNGSFTQLGSTLTGKMYLFGRVLTATADAVTVTNLPNGVGNFGRRYLFRGGNGAAYSGTLASNYEDFGEVGSITATTVDVPDLTNGTANSLGIAWLGICDDANVITAPIGWAIPVTMFADPSGSDGTLSVGTFDLQAATTTTVGSYDIRDSDPTATYSLVLKPVTNQTVTPTTLAVVTATFAPTVTASNHQSVTPTTAALVTATFAPVIALAVTPATASLVTATFAPTVTATAHQTVTPTTASLTTSTFAPTVTAPALATPTTASLTLTTLAPTVTATDHQTVTPGLATLVTATFAPTVTAPALATPDPAALLLTTFAPTVSATAHITVTPTTTALVTQTFAPTVTAFQGLTVTPTAASLVLALFAPDVVLTDNLLVTPGAAVLALTTFAPVVTAIAPVTVTPTTASLVLAAFAPTVLVTGPIEHIVGTITVGPIIVGSISGQAGRGKLTVNPSPIEATLEIE